MRIMMFLLFPLIGILYLTFFFIYQDCDCFVLFPLIDVLCFTGFVYPDCDIFGTVLSSWCFMLHWFCFAYPDCDYLIQFWPVLYVALMYVLWLFDTVLTGVICGTDVRIVIVWYSSDRCYMWHWCTHCDYLIQFWPVLYVALMYVLWLFDTVLTGVWHWCTYCDDLIQFWPVLYVALMYVLWLFDTVLTGVWHWCTYCDDLIQFWPVLYVALMYVLWWFDTVLTGVICGTDVRIVMIWYSSDRCYMWHWCTYCDDFIVVSNWSLVLYLADQWLL